MFRDYPGFCQLFASLATGANNLGQTGTYRLAKRLEPPEMQGAPMAEPSCAPGDGGSPEAVRFRGAPDALASRQRILHTARMFTGDRHVTMAELAAAADVWRVSP